jgi:hypothetical protein
MGITIGQPGAVADASGATASPAIATALSAQVQSAQTAEIEALFGSLGLGTNASAVA